LEKKDQLVQVAKAWGTHGLKGELKINPLTQDLGLLDEVGQVWLWNGSAATEPKPVQLAGLRPVQGHWLISFEGLQDINLVEPYKQMGVYVEPDALAPLGEDEFFIHDLLGSRVFDLDGQLLGQVRECFENGDQWVFEVDDVAGGTFLFPGVGEFLKEVDGPAKRVVVDLPPGMRELNKKGGSLE